MVDHTANIVALFYYSVVFAVINGVLMSLLILVQKRRRLVFVPRKVRRRIILAVTRI